MTHPDLVARSQTVARGALVTLAVGAGVALYVAATPQGPHRAAILLLVAGALADALGFWRAREVVAGTRRFGAWMAVWNCAHGAAVAVAVALDGGLQSPLKVIPFLCVAFAAVSLCRRAVVAVALFHAVALLAAAAVTGGRGMGEAGLVVCVMLAMAVVCAATAGDRERRSAALRESQEELLRRLLRVVEFRDDETGDHIERMSRYSAVLAAAAGHPAAPEDFRLAATMHDIGKVAVPDSILLKPGPLDADERTVMERHAELGHRMLCDSTNHALRLGADIALTHHERWDGGGYPRGLAGEAIPLAGRIVAVADAFDALTSDRVYRRAVPVARAVEVIAADAGRQFDPAVVRAFLAALPELESIHATGEPRAVAAPAARREAWRPGARPVAADVLAA